MPQDAHGMTEAFKEAALANAQQAELNDRLVDAAIEGNLVGAGILLAKGADPRADHAFAMCVAVSREDMKMLEAFLAVCSASVPNEAPLRTAIMERKPEMALKLVKNGAKPETVADWVSRYGSDFHRRAFKEFEDRLHPPETPARIPARGL